MIFTCKCNLHVNVNSEICRIPLLNWYYLNHCHLHVNCVIWYLWLYLCLYFVDVVVEIKVLLTFEVELTYVSYEYCIMWFILLLLLLLLQVLRGSTMFVYAFIKGRVATCVGVIRSVLLTWAILNSHVVWSMRFWHLLSNWVNRSSTTFVTLKSKKICSRVHCGTIQ